MAKIVDFELHKRDQDLTGLVDPCSECRQYPFCVNTCERASAWWDEFARKFKRNQVINMIGGK